MRICALILLTILLSSCSRYEEFSSAKIVVSNAAVFTDEVLLYGFNDDGQKFSAKFRPNENKTIELEVGDWVFYGVAAGGGLKVLCTYQNESIMSPEDNIEITFNEETCADSALTNSNYLDDNGKPMAVEFRICENFDDVFSDSIDCGANKALGVQSTRVMIDSPNGQIDLGCQPSISGEGSMDIGFPLPRFYEQGIELRFMTFSDDHCLMKLDEAHLINGLHETFYLEHVVTDIHDDGSDELILFFDSSFLSNVFIPGGAPPMDDGGGAPPQLDNGGGVINRNTTMPNQASIISDFSKSNNPYPEFEFNDLLEDSDGVIFTDSNCAIASEVGEFFHDGTKGWESLIA